MESLWFKKSIHTCLPMCIILRRDIYQGSKSVAENMNDFNTFIFVLSVRYVLYVKKDFNGIFTRIGIILIIIFQDIDCYKSKVARSENKTKFIWVYLFQNSWLSIQKYFNGFFKKIQNERIWFEEFWYVRFFWNIIKTFQ